ncbi:MAG: hypothetical protein QOD95_3292 [Gammaproteobacteria bacterium]|jgi:hypothetical protein|nr:hypothetical protein [Gammaproteobacteria bacterium]
MTLTTATLGGHLAAQGAVIKLIETRRATPLAFDQVKAQLAVNLQQERREKFIQTVLA